MGFTERMKKVDQIGSIITEAGCDVIFNQRLMQSDNQWHRSQAVHRRAPHRPSQRHLGAYVQPLALGADHDASDNVNNCEPNEISCYHNDCTQVN